MSLPYFPLYAKDFEAKTSHLTIEEDGAYNRLLRLCWMMPGCTLPDDDKWIMRRMRVDKETYDRVVLVIIDEFFKRENGRVMSPYIDWSEETKRKQEPRPAIPLDVIRGVQNRDGQRCVYCGDTEGPFELDHIVPWSRGGNHETKNLVVACRTCNRQKSNRTPDEMGWLI